MNDTTRRAVTARPLVRRTGPALWTRLPAGGWQVRVWKDAGGQALLDVAAPEGTLVCRLASTSGAALSIEACWASCDAAGPGPHGSGQCWALAAGRAPAGLGHVVSFAPRAGECGRGRMTLPFESSSGVWITHYGLWMAAAIGCYTHVRLGGHSEVRLRSADSLPSQAEAPRPPHRDDGSLVTAARNNLAAREDAVGDSAAWPEGRPLPRVRVRRVLRLRRRLMPCSRPPPGPALRRAAMRATHRVGFRRQTVMAPGNS
jgi:hypothetical protein